MFAISRYSLYLLLAIISFTSPSVSARDFSVDEEQVLKAYIAYYGRNPDVGGLAYWANTLDTQNGDLSAIIVPFGNSYEFDSRFGSYSNEQLVVNLYQQMFGRNPDSGGLSYYTSALDNQTQILQNIAMDIIGGVQGNDLAIINSLIATAKSGIETQEQQIANNLKIGRAHV